MYSYCTQYLCIATLATTTNPPHSVATAGLTVTTQFLTSSAPSRGFITLNGPHSLPSQDPTDVTSTIKYYNSKQWDIRMDLLSISLILDVLRLIKFQLYDSPAPPDLTLRLGISKQTMIAGLWR